MTYEQMGMTRTRKRMAKTAVEDFARGYHKRLRSLAATADVADGVDPGAEFDVKVVRDCFDIWCSNALCDQVTTMSVWDDSMTSGRISASATQSWGADSWRR
jgi:hypothetical protein